MKKFYRMFALLIMLYFVTTAVSAEMQYQYNIDVQMVGIGSHGTTVYVGLSPNPNTCQWEAIYFIEQAEIDKALSVAMAAKLAGKKVRMDYIQPGGAGTMCYGDAIYIQ